MLRSHVITDFLRDSGHTLRVEITYLKLKLGLPIFFLSSPFHATNDEGKHNGNLPNFNVKNLRNSEKWLDGAYVIILRFYRFYTITLV